MSNLKSVEIKAFVPAQDFELSKRFCQDLGFTMASDGGGIVARYGVRVTQPVKQPWAMIDFALIDPAGVCWRIAQNIPRDEGARP